MSGEVLFGRFLVCLESCFKNDLKIGRYLGSGHRVRSGRFTHVEGMLVGWQRRGSEGASEHAHVLCPCLLDMDDRRSKTNMRTPPRV